jgi:WD40 repeat protein
VWKSDTFQRLQAFTFHLDTILDVAWKSCQAFATASADCDVGVCTIGGGFVVLKGHTDHVNAVCYNASFNMLASAGSDKAVRIWRQTGCDLLEGHDAGVSALEWVPRSDSLVVSGAADGIVRIWNAAKCECIRAIDHRQEGLISIGISPKGDYVVSGSQDQNVAVSRIADGEVVVTFTGNSEVFDVAWDPTGRFVSACFDDSTVAVIPVSRYLT